MRSVHLAAVFALLSAIAVADEVHHRNNAELVFMVQADQSDREPPVADWPAVRKRDRARIARLKEMIQQSLLHTSMDYCNAALIFQHGFEPADYLRAHDLAVHAVTLGPSNGSAKWLAAAAEDRYLQSIGKPQIYGTQFHLVDGVWTLAPIDENAVTDAERAQWQVPPLSDAKQRVATMNAAKQH